MGMHNHEVHQLQQAVNKLQRKGIGRIVVVPLFISSHSEVFRQFEYLFGLRPEAVWPEAGPPLTLRVPVTMGKGLDDNPVVGEILLDRARALSRQPERETVVIVAHGPNGEEENEHWIDNIRPLSERIKREGGFRAVIGMTIRDDAPKPIQDRAMRELRSVVQGQSEAGRVIVVPLLMARGGIEQKIPKLLAGLTHTYSGETLLPDKRIVQWIATQAETLAGREGPVGSVPVSPSVIPVHQPSGEGAYPVIQ
jgi:sirohydrochlorin ferrochelatase